MEPMIIPSFAFCGTIIMITVQLYNTVMYTCMIQYVYHAWYILIYEYYVDTVATRTVYTVPGYR